MVEYSHTRNAERMHASGAPYLKLISSVSHGLKGGLLVQALIESERL